MQHTTAPNPVGCPVQQQDEILAQAHRTCRDDRSLQFPAEIGAIVHKAAVIMHSKGDEFAKPFPPEMGKPFVKRRARSISAPTFSTSTLDNAKSFLAPDRSMRRRGPCSQWAVCPSIVAPRISRKLSTKSCEISSRRKHGH
jgi:hypothetical protein